MPASSTNTNTDFQAFNNTAFATLFDTLYEPLCRFALKMIGDSEQTEDIVQEQFVYVWENWDRLSEIDSLSAYLYKAVRNRSINHITKQSKQSHFTNFDGEEGFTQVSTLTNPHQLLESKDLENILEEALDSLPEKCKNIFVLKRFGDLSNKEIAEKLNISIKTVEAQMTIALRRLKKSISENWHTIILLFTSTLSTFL